MNNSWDDDQFEPTVLTDNDFSDNDFIGNDFSGNDLSDHDDNPVMPKDGTKSLPIASVHAGEVFAGRYRLEQQLAQRGATLTWRAFDQKLSRSVLVHILAPHDPRTPTTLDAARQAAAATDSRFLRVLDAVGGDDPDSPALVVCEYAPGQSLERLLMQGPLGGVEAAWIVREVADAMSQMHTQGLFHQRLNPDTVIITATGNVKIVGFLIEAALHPDPHQDSTTWSERERRDVTALGKLLYTGLVALWPLDTDNPAEPHFSMAGAPRTSGGWLSPLQIRSSVSPQLDAICDQILSAQPQHHEVPMRTAGEVSSALSKVLGTADAAADLEHRMRFPVTQVQPDTRAAVAAGRQAIAGATGAPAAREFNDLAETAQWDPALDDPTGSSLSPVATGAAASWQHKGGSVAPDPGSTAQFPEASDGASASTASNHQSTPRSDDDRDLVAADLDADGSSPGRGNGKTKLTPLQRQRRLIAALIGLVVLSLIVGVVAALFSQNSKPSSSKSAGATATTYTIASGTAFDPSTDGGNGEENNDQVALAYDGKADTAWHTVTYFNNAKLGNLKPGVGIVLDLGKAENIGVVQATLVGKPTGVAVYVPTQAGDTAPTTSIKDWKQIAATTATGTDATLTPTSAVSSRFVLVYLTSLPQIATGRYQGAIAEVQVKS